MRAADDEHLRALEDLLGPRRRTPKGAIAPSPSVPEEATPDEAIASGTVEGGVDRQGEGQLAASGRPAGTAAARTETAEGAEAHGIGPAPSASTNTAAERDAHAAGQTPPGAEPDASGGEGASGASVLPDSGARDPSGPGPDPLASGAPASGAPLRATAPVVPAPPVKEKHRRDAPPDGGGDVLDAETVPDGQIVALSPLDPAIGLAQRLRQDRLVTVPARPWPRVAALAFAGVSLLLWVFALRASALGRPWPGPGIPASVAWWLLAAASLAALPIMARMWPAREMRLPLAATQGEQLIRVEAQARRMRLLIFVGALAALGGLAVLALAFRFAPVQSWSLPVGLGSLLLAGGTVAAIVGVGRWLPVRMLYVQTLVLERLEGLGLGRQLGVDQRTADVLAALDTLLGELPESAVREFLSRPEAEWYLEVIARIRGRRDGR